MYGASMVNTQSTQSAHQASKLFRRGLTVHNLDEWWVHVTKEGQGLSCKHTRVCIRRSRTHQKSWGHLRMWRASDSEMTDAAASWQGLSATAAKLLLWPADLCRSLIPWADEGPHVKLPLGPGGRSDIKHLLSRACTADTGCAACMQSAGPLGQLLRQASTDRPPAHRDLWG